MSDAALLLTDLTKRFGSFTAVDDLSLEVPRGCVYGFLGPNGAGKTTTIRMALSIYAPTSGRVAILGRPSALDVRERIGYLPEEKGLYKKMRAASLIAYFGRLKGMDRRTARRRAHELLERYGLGEFTGRRCEALSKGMGQKVQVLASIVHDPELVILDEPFSGLDPVNQEVMQGVIDDLRERGRTIVFSTHIMEHAERLCDRIVLIARGRRAFDGTVAEARALVPRRLLLETGADPAPLLSVPGVLSIDPAPGAEQPDRYEVVLEASARVDAVLRACFEAGIELRAFDRREPGLREVFLHLVGPEHAAEEVA
jgi:ABC-2 type transport system ATP-binding protein